MLIHTLARAIIQCKNKTRKDLFVQRDLTQKALIENKQCTFKLLHVATKVLLLQLFLKNIHCTVKKDIRNLIKNARLVAFELNTRKSNRKKAFCLILLRYCKRHKSQTLRYSICTLIHKIFESKFQYFVNLVPTLFFFSQTKPTDKITFNECSTRSLKFLLICRKPG